MTRRYPIPAGAALGARARRPDRCNHSGCTRPKEPGFESCLTCREANRASKKKQASGRAAAAAYLAGEWAKRRGGPTSPPNGEEALTFLAQCRTLSHIK